MVFHCACILIRQPRARRDALLSQASTFPINNPSKLARLLYRRWLKVPQLRAVFSPAHPLARLDVPLARARAFRFSIPLFQGRSQVVLDCAHRTSTFLSCAFCEQKGHLATPSPPLLAAPEITSPQPSVL
jgi:hypothetical protein